jgi:hypothetical protein
MYGKEKLEKMNDQNHNIKNQFDQKRDQIYRFSNGVWCPVSHLIKIYNEDKGNFMVLPKIEEIILGNTFSENLLTQKDHRKILAKPVLNEYQIITVLYWLILEPKLGQENLSCMLDTDSSYRIPFHSSEEDSLSWWNNSRDACVLIWSENGFWRIDINGFGPWPTEKRKWLHFYV